MHEHFLVYYDCVYVLQSETSPLCCVKHDFGTVSVLRYTDSGLSYQVQISQKVNLVRQFI